MSTIHRAFDPDENWRTRLEAEQARRAIEDARHARNAELQTFWTDVFAVVAMGTIVAAFLYEAYRKGLFKFLEAL